MALTKTSKTKSSTSKPVKIIFDIDVNEKLAEDYGPGKPTDNEQSELILLAFKWSSTNIPDGVAYNVNAITTRRSEMVVYLKNPDNYKTSNLKHTMYPNKPEFGNLVQGHKRYTMRFRSSNERSGILMIIVDVYSKELTDEDKAPLRAIYNTFYPTQSVVLEEQRRSNNKTIRKTKSLNWIIYLVDQGPNEEFDEIVKRKIPYNRASDGKQVLITTRRGEDVEEQEKRLKRAGLDEKLIEDIIGKRKAQNFINQNNAIKRLNEATEEDKKRKKDLKDVEKVKVVKPLKNQKEILRELIEIAETEEEKEKFSLLRRIEIAKEKGANKNTQFALDMREKYNLDKEDGPWLETGYITKEMRNDLLEAIKIHEKEVKDNVERLERNYNIAYGDQKEATEKQIASRTNGTQTTQSVKRTATSPPQDGKAAKANNEGKSPEKGPTTNSTTSRKTNTIKTSKDGVKYVQLGDQLMPYSSVTKNWSVWSNVTWHYFKTADPTMGITCLRSNQKWISDNEKLLAGISFQQTNAPQLLFALNQLYQGKFPRDEKSIYIARAATYFFGPRYNNGKFSRKQIDVADANSLPGLVRTYILEDELAMGNLSSLVPVFIQAMSITYGDTNCWPTAEGFGKVAIPHIDPVDFIRLLNTKQMEEIQEKGEEAFQHTDLLGGAVTPMPPITSVED